MKNPVIMLVEHDELQRNQWRACLQREGFEVIVSSDANGIFHALRQQQSQWQRLLKAQWRGICLPYVRLGGTPP